MARTDTNKHDSDEIHSEDKSEQMEIVESYIGRMAKSLVF